jgi:hypothetical protein
LRFALGFACLAAWALVLGLLPPHEEISAAPGALEVSEREITYDGAPVRLRGVATEDVRDLHLEGRDPASEYASMANNWRANVVRISVHPSTWRYHETETLELLKEHVGAATDAGLFVIVDYHVIGFPTGTISRSRPSGATRPTSTTRTSPGHGLLGRGLHRGTGWARHVRALERAGRRRRAPPSDPDSSRWSELKPYFEELVSTIRRNSSQSVILATGNHWAFNLEGINDDPLDDPNTAYTWHVYAGHEGNDPGRWAAALDGLHETKPVVVTEWGFQPRARPLPRHREDVRDQIPRPLAAGQGAAQHRLVLEQVPRPVPVQTRLADPHDVGRVRLRLPAEAQPKPRAPLKA